MTPSLRELIADVLRPELDSGCVPDVDPLADALLADLTLAAIIDLAADLESTEMTYEDIYNCWKYHSRKWSPEVRALLQAWRAER